MLPCSCSASAHTIRPRMPRANRSCAPTAAAAVVAADVAVATEAPYPSSGGCCTAAAGRRGAASLTLGPLDGLSMSFCWPSDSLLISGGASTTSVRPSPDFFHSPLATAERLPCRARC